MESVYPPLDKDMGQGHATAPPQDFRNYQQPQAAPIVTAPTTMHAAAATFQVGPPINVHAPVGPHSMDTTCPQCHCRVRTTVRHRATTKTHIACLLLSWTCCCCCLPYCMDSCRNANHFCPMCGHFIGTYES